MPIIGSPIFFKKNSPQIDLLSILIKDCDLASETIKV